MPNDEALAYNCAALEASKESGNLSTIAMSTFIRGFTFLWREEFVEAESFLHEALSVAIRCGESQVQMLSMNYLALAARWQHHVDDAKAWAVQVQQMPITLPPFYQCAVLGHLAWVARRRGDLLAAREYVAKAVEMSGSAGMIVNMFQFLFRWPGISLALLDGKIAEAVEHGQAMLHPVHKRMPDDLTGELEKAVQAWANSQPESARQHLETAAQIAEAKGYL
jgi:hypothetical protein